MSITPIPSLALVAALPLVVAAAAAGTSQTTERATEARTAYGAAVAVGGGEARVYVTTERGAPVEVGVALSEAALTGLPADGDHGGVAMPDGHHTYVKILRMPAENPTPYEFVALDWNPGGHEPPGIYDRPHFDFHFNAISEAEHRTIVPSNPDFAAKGARHPAAAFVPAGYVPVAGPVPLMGQHWADPRSPELNGRPFTETFLYGTWDGRLIFAEPMVTKAFLETRPDHREPIAVPAKYERAGWHPTEYRVYWDAAAKEYRVALSGFVRRQ